MARRPWGCGQQIDWARAEVNLRAECDQGTQSQVFGGQHLRMRSDSALEICLCVKTRLLRDRDLVPLQVKHASHRRSAGYPAGPATPCFELRVVIIESKEIRICRTSLHNDHSRALRGPAWARGNRAPRHQPFAHVGEERDSSTRLRIPPTTGATGRLCARISPV
jgi:hypothetical protein